MVYIRQKMVLTMWIGQSEPYEEGENKTVTGPIGKRPLQAPSGKVGPGRIKKKSCSWREFSSSFLSGYE
jgi:hypothetical protein